MNGQNYRVYKKCTIKKTAMYTVYIAVFFIDT